MAPLSLCCLGKSPRSKRRLLTTTAQKIIKKETKVLCLIIASARSQKNNNKKKQRSYYIFFLKAKGLIILISWLLVATKLKGGVALVDKTGEAALALLTTMDTTEKLVVSFSL